MKVIKIIVAIAAGLIIASLSAPLWGGCNFNQKLCQTWCDVRHIGSKINKTACQASCLTDKVSCMAK